MMALFVSREDHLKPILNLRTIVLVGVRLRGSVFLGLVPMLRYHGLGINLFLFWPWADRWDGLQLHCTSLHVTKFQKPPCLQ